MGDVVVLSKHRRRHKAKARMAEMVERGFMGPADVSSLTLDIDAVLAELGAVTGMVVTRTRPITGRTQDNVIDIGASRHREDT